MTADGVAAGVAGVDAATAAVGDVAGDGLLGAAVGEVTGPDTACPERMPGVWCAEAARAMPPAADAASSPTTIEAIVSGRASRRRRRTWCRPGRPAAGWETGDGLADVTVLDASPVSGSSMNVRVTGSGGVAVIAPALAANSRSRAVGRWRGSLARQRWISPRTSAGTRSRFTSRWTAR